VLMIVSMSESIEEGRSLFRNSGNISARVGLPIPGQSTADKIVDIRELKLLSEFSHPNIVKFVSHPINTKQKLMCSAVSVSRRIIARSHVCSLASYVRMVICLIIS
jgi:hypothetical protein